MKKSFYSALLLFLFATTVKGEQYHIQAGAATVNITPPVGIWQVGWLAREKPSESIADEIYAKALVLSDGQTRVAIITMDLLKTHQSMVDSLRNDIYTRTGIKQDHILITASHTHFAPRCQINATGPYEKAYALTVLGKIAGAVQTANSNMQDAWVGAVKGHAPEYTFNRRVVKEDGTVFNSWRYPKDTTGLTFGPIDPDVGVFVIDNRYDQSIARIINYATHPVCGMNEMYAISADFPRYATDVIEKIEGGICMFALGTAGNQVPVEREGYSRYQIGRGIGAEALKALQRKKVYANFPIGVITQKIRMATKKNTFVKGDSVDVEIQVMAIGDIVIVGLPGEVMVELGLELKAKSGLENVFIFELSNGGNVGYILSEQDYADGGYEALNGALGPGSGEMIVNTALQLIQKLKPVTSAAKTEKPAAVNSSFESFSQKGYDIKKKQLQE